MLFTADFEGDHFPNQAVILRLVRELPNRGQRIADERFERRFDLLAGQVLYCPECLAYFLGEIADPELAGPERQSVQNDADEEGFRLVR